MSSFTELTVTWKPAEKLWSVDRDCTYDIGELGGDEKIVIKKEFRTDFGSVPRALWWLVSPIGDATPAYVLHDWLYHTGERSRLVSDAILLEAMEICKVNRFQRWMIYRGVRMGGWLAWRKHRKRTIERTA